MSHLIPNQFSSYSMTDEEIKQGSILTITQKEVMQTLLASIAEEKLSLTHTLSEPLMFALQDAEKKGAIDILTYILAVSEDLQTPEAPELEV